MTPRVLPAVFVVAVAAAPLVLPEFQVTLLGYIALGALVALGLVLLTGVAGLTSFGQAAFVGIGAYTSAWLSTTHALPAWLAPHQAVVLDITDSQSGYAVEVAEMLQKQGVRVQTDLRNEKVGYKIREHSMQKVPYILVVGDKEKANGTVAVRARGNQDLGVMKLDDFAQKLIADIASRR